MKRSHTAAQAALKNYLRYHNTNPSQALTVALLLGVMSWDEIVTESELSMISDIADAWGVSKDKLHALTDIHPNFLIAATIDIARESFEHELLRVLMTLSMHMMMADDKIVFGERLLLDILQDAFAFSDREMRECYREALGRDMPPMVDPSDPTYYDYIDQQRARQRSQERSQKGSHERQHTTSASEPPTVHAALKVFGLNGTTTIDAIRKRYRHLALRHHPDRNPNADEMTRKTMEREFFEIKIAYNVLIDHYA